MKKLIIWIISAVVFIIIIIWIVWYIKFEVQNNDIYIETNSWNIVKYNDILKIQTSITPIASITNYIAWDFAEVSSIIPAWVSPHWYDLKPEQMVNISKSDLVIYLNFDEIDAFLNKILKDKDKLIVSDWIDLYEWEEHNHEEDNHEEENPEEHSDEEEIHSVDPHIWTSSINAIVIAEKIKNKLIELDPENKIYFENNLISFKKELQTAKNNFLSNTKNKNQIKFIIFHDAYNYLFNDVNIDSNKKLVFQENILAWPSSSKMKELIDEIKLHWVKIAFREPQLNDSNLQKLSNDYNLEILILDPLWFDNSKNWYIQNYKNNLESLEKIYE